MKKTTSILIAVCTVALALVIGIFVYQNNSDSVSPSSSETPANYLIVVTTPTFTNSYEVEVKNNSLFEDLQLLAETNDFDFEYSEASFGVYITGMNGYSATSEEFWQISLNEEQATVGVSDLTPAADDQIIFEVVAIEAY